MRILACQLPLWVAAFESFAEAVFPAGGAVPSSGLAAESPAFPQLCTWHLIAFVCVILL